MTSPLENLCGPQGAIQAEPPDAREFANLVRSGETRLNDADNPTVSLEGRFDCAYGAAHSLCLAALRYRGYRPRNRRYIVFQVLPHTLGIGPEVWLVLHKAHQIRNVGDYEGGLDVSEQLLIDLIAACRIVREKITQLAPLDQ